MVKDKFMTVQNVVFNMLISCYSIPEFVALRYSRSLSGKTIENAKKRVLLAMNGVLFTKSVSNKFKSMQKFHSNM